MRNHHKALNEVATWQPLLTAWDTLLPGSRGRTLERDCLSYYPGKVVNFGAQMPGIWLVVQDAEGHYGNSVHVLLYKGHMLVYEPGNELSEWVPIRGVLSSLTSVELRSANDLTTYSPAPTLEVSPQEHSSLSLSTVSQLETRLTQTV